MAAREGAPAWNSRRCSLAHAHAHAQQRSLPHSRSSSPARPLTLSFWRTLALFPPPRVSSCRAPMQIASVARNALFIELHRTHTRARRHLSSDDVAGLLVAAWPMMLLPALYIFTGRNEPSAAEHASAAPLSMHLPPACARRCLQDSAYAAVHALASLHYRVPIEGAATYTAATRIKRCTSAAHPSGLRFEASQAATDGHRLTSGWLLEVVAWRAPEAVFCVAS
eukprot:6186481-Pleurochrysis_carterae.AAC.5